MSRLFLNIFSGLSQSEKVDSVIESLRRVYDRDNKIGATVIERVYQMVLFHQYLPLKMYFQYSIARLKWVISQYK